MNNDWIKYVGKGQPVADDVVVEARVFGLEEEWQCTSAHPAKGWGWNWFGTEPQCGDIIKYRIVESKQEEIKHSHYFKEVPYSHIDIYRLLEIFEVTNPCLQHCIKKLLCAGNRGHKDLHKDIQDCIDTLVRWQQMRKEDEECLNKP